MKGAEQPNDYEDVAIAIGLFAIWLFSIIYFSAQNNHHHWWYAFPFIVIFAILGALSSPISKILTSYIFSVSWRETELSHWQTIVFWPFLLPLAIMAAFFVLMGRLAR